MDCDAQQAPKAVPQFSSFRVHTPTSKSAGSHESDTRSRSTQHRHKSKNDAGKRRERRSISVTPNHAVNGLPESKKRFVEWDESPTTFTIDVKGDSRNLDYGTSYGVPTYSRNESRIALGTETGSGSLAHRSATGDHTNDSISKRIVKNIGRQKVHRVIADPASSPNNDAWAEFVHLEQSKRRKREVGDEAAGESRFYNPNDEFRYSSEGTARRPTDAGVEAENSLEASGSDHDGPHLQASFLDERLRQRRAALSSQVKQDPTDWVSWLAVVELQDEVDGFLDVSSQARHTNAERRSNAEVELSIYETALRSVTDPEGREQLHMGMMSKAPLVWERRRCSLKWQMILKEHQLSHRLWKSYLDFHQSRPLDFSLEETRRHYLDLLQDMRGDRASEQASSAGSYMIQLYILLRLTLLLSEGDYTELAAAIWQALLEFTLNRPQHLRSDTQREASKINHDAALSAFEQFWESEVPRIGEANARGWLNYQTDGDEQAPSLAAIEALPLPGGSAISTWAAVERQASSCSKTPSRAMDTSSEDPYRVVLFSDIQPALLDSYTSFERHAILAAFLCFCHLPPHTNDPDKHVSSWYQDQFVRNELLYDNIPKSAPSNSSDLSPAADTPFAFPLAEHPNSSDTLFANAGKWFSAFGQRTWNRGPIPEEFILATLKMLVNQGFGDDSLAEYLLAFELQVSPTTVLKSAKSLLKKRPSSLPLYNAYALIQSRVGNGEIATTIFDTAIQMSNRLDQAARRHVILLWRTRIWELLGSGETATALEQLLKFDIVDGDGKTTDRGSATAHLRLRNALSAGRDEMLSLQIPALAIHYSELLVLLDYLTSSNSLPTAFSTFTSNLHLLAQPTITTTTTPHSRTSSSEILLRQSLARLLYTHVLHKRPYSPRTIRAFLAESIAASPTNTIFLSLYAWNEARFRIDDRVRSIVRDVVLHSSSRRRRHHPSGTPEAERPLESDDNVIPHHFAIYTDLHRGLAQGSNLHAVRGTFERALRTEAAAGNNAGLWKWYLDFEHGNGDVKRARGVFYRAVRACPWVKELYMLAIERFGDDGGGRAGMGEDELKGVREMMVERELRIRVGM
ncbi:MAG: hypothetical protein Q9207_001363 [Kuettlingeria erythrocarpa]